MRATPVATHTRPARSPAKLPHLREQTIGIVSFSLSVLQALGQPSGTVSPEHQDQALLRVRFCPRSLPPPGITDPTSAWGASPVPSRLAFSAIIHSRVFLGKCWLPQARPVS